ncbi:MAG: ribonuclease III [Planctomycetales bacterium 4572_13]|nr:MAG: ribonuclease III [Planctomycetales bacterium 4572_13]
MNADTVQQIQQILGHPFGDPQILDEAFLHSSAASNRLRSNERMEFLGDSVLSLVICDTLFRRFSHYQEGDLTKIKSRLVSRKTCADIANALQLPSFMKVGKGMERSRAMSGSVAAASLESVIAAIYLDGGMNAAETFILRVFDSMIAEADAAQHQENFKSLLQQYCQRQHNATPFYELLDEKGPDHNKCFKVAAVIQHHRYPDAWGVTKKEAEQCAAYEALVEIGIIPQETGSDS